MEALLVGLPMQFTGLAYRVYGGGAIEKMELLEWSALRYSHSQTAESSAYGLKWRLKFTKRFLSGKINDILVLLFLFKGFHYLLRSEGIPSIFLQVSFQLIEG